SAYGTDPPSSEIARVSQNSLPPPSGRRIDSEYCSGRAGTGNATLSVPRETRVSGGSVGPRSAGRRHGGISTSSRPEPVPAVDGASLVSVGVPPLLAAANPTIVTDRTTIDRRGAMVRTC